jgi:hypothetical protein
MLFSHYLQGALVPRSVALVGASSRSGALGTYVLGNLLAGGFKGQIHLVNPKYKELAGQVCYPRVADLPQAPDLVVVVTPPKTVPDLIDDAPPVVRAPCSSSRQASPMPVRPAASCTRRRWRVRVPRVSACWDRTASASCDRTLA